MPQIVMQVLGIPYQLDNISIGTPHGRKIKIRLGILEFLSTQLDPFVQDLHAFALFTAKS